MTSDRNLQPATINRRTAIKLCGGYLALPVLAGCTQENKPAIEPGTDTNIPAQSEILIKGGTVVTESATTIWDVRITSEKIVEIGADLKPNSPDSKIIDASGKHVLPGGIDPHVHLSEPWCDDFKSGSQAALAGGITTLAHMSFPRRGQTLLQTYTEEKAAVERDAICDFFFHLVATDPASVDTESLRHLVEIGQPSLKLFMLTEQFANSPMQVADLMRAARELGIVCVIHAEDHVILKAAARKLTDAGNDSLDFYAQSRPVEAEVKAARHAIALCLETGASVYLVHISSAKAVAIAEEAQSNGLPVFVETRPMYLHLTDEIYEHDDAALFVGMPPVRTAEDQQRLWDGINRGIISTVATDHAPWTRDQKLEDGLTINNPRGGVNNLQVMLPMLMNEVVLAERISLEKFVEVTSTNAAKIFGVYPEKGVVAEGSFADLVIWDLNETRVVENEGFSNAGFSIYAGTSVTGWPMMTMRRGEIVFQDGNIMANGGGKVIARRVGG